MAFEKTQKEIDIMTECGKRLRASYEQLVASIQPGQTTLEIDTIADQLLAKNNLEASFKTVEGYRWATCLAVNHQAVHTPPSLYVLKSGDVLTIDFGGLYHGYHTDWATTIIVGNEVNYRKDRFLTTGKIALKKTIESLKVGEYLGIVGKIMQSEIEGAGYKVLRELTGHGIGVELHEDPYIPNVVLKPIHKTYKIKPNFVAAIEVIYAESTERIVQTSPEGWSLDTSDSSLAACFEHTVAIQQDGVHILT